MGKFLNNLKQVIYCQMLINNQWNEKKVIPKLFKSKIIAMFSTPNIIKYLGEKIKTYQFPK